MPGHTRRQSSPESTSSADGGSQTSQPSVAGSNADRQSEMGSPGAGESSALALAAAVDPEWSGPEISGIQRELRRLGLYNLRIDTILGKGSKRGLVEAFGGERWRTMSADAVMEELRGATAPEGGLDNFRYGELFKDGVLDLTVGVGYDEDENHLDAIEGFGDVLSNRGFSIDPGRAAELYTQAGRTAESADFGQFYVRENAIQYTPPVGGDPRPIHAVVRLVFSETGEEGGQASQAFREGMAQSDVAYYSGHGRYGSGPDFDRNMSFTLLDADGNSERDIDDYTVLQRALAAEGRSAGRGAWAQFLWRERNDRIEVHGSNAGNVFINPDNLHRGEFGANLMYWSLQREGQGAQLQTGPEGPLAEAMEEPEARDYRVLVFDGCRTRDYVRSVRRTPGLDSNGADVLATTRTVNWGDEVRTLAEFLDGIIEQSNRSDIIESMDQQQSPSSAGGQRGGAYRGY